MFYLALLELRNETQIKSSAFSLSLCKLSISSSNLVPVIQDTTTTTTLPHPTNHFRRRCRII